MRSVRDAIIKSRGIAHPINELLGILSVGARGCVWQTFRSGTTGEL
jgi:hypothetical protein